MIVRIKVQFLCNIHIPNMQGDEISLQKALNMVHRNNNDYVAVLFHAYWCPFSQIFRPTLSILSSLYPSIPHFAIEESGIRQRFVLSSIFNWLLWLLRAFSSWLKIASIKSLQHIIKVWSSWFPYIIHFKFYHACSLSWISDPWLSHRILQWCYW